MKDLGDIEFEVPENLPEPEWIVAPPSNPMAVARQFVDEHYADERGWRLLHHRGRYYAWTGTHWPETEDRRVRAAEIVREELRTEQEARTPGAWPEWMTLRTAAKYLDLTEPAARHLVKEGQLPYFQARKGCRIEFRRSELDQWKARDRMK